MLSAWERSLFDGLTCGVLARVEAPLLELDKIARRAKTGGKCCTAELQTWCLHRVSERSAIENRQGSRLDTLDSDEKDCKHTLQRL